jgi:hypothetical protein
MKNSSFNEEQINEILTEQEQGMLKVMCTASIGWFAQS